MALAKELGIEEAIFIDEIHHQIKKNILNGRNFHDGRFWTYNSLKAYEGTFPYLNASKIKRTINSLVDKGILMKGNFNTNQYDRTCWYAFTDYGLCMVQKCYIDELKMTNGKVENDSPIPTTIPTTKTTISFTHSDERSEGDLFDETETSTITMLSSEDKLPYTADKAERGEKFEDLWQLYERKGSKANAKKEFAKLTDAEIAQMQVHIPAYLQSRPEKRYRQDFERYIKNRTFNSVVYGAQNEVLYDPEADNCSATPAQEEFKKQNETVTISGVTYR